MTSKHTLKYGSRSIEFSLPNDNFLGIITPRKLSPLKDVHLAVLNSLRNPIGTSDLSSIVARDDKVAIIVSDHTRTTRTDLFLPILLSILEKADIPDANIRVVFATGMHRKHRLGEMESIVGRETAMRVSLIDHDSTDASSHTLIGFTRRGTPVRVDKNVAEADHVILTGAIGYHYFAGYGGGRKSLLPGVCALESIECNHLLTLHPEPGKGLHPRARAGRLVGNPVHEDMLDALNLLKSVFLLNVVLDEHKNIAAVFAGHPVEAHLRGCEYVDRYFSIPIERKADLVVAGCGGTPKDASFIQAHKAMDNAFGALRDGGALVFAAECTEGLGNPDILKWFDYTSAESHEAALRKEYVINGHSALYLRLKTSRARVFLFSSLQEAVVEKLGMTPVKSLEEGLEKAMSHLGKATPTTWFIPDASEALPR